MNGTIGTPAPMAAEPTTSLTQPFAPGNKGIWASILTMLATGASPVIADKLNVPTETAVASVGVFGLSLQYLFARLRDRRHQKRLAAAAGSR